jgi:hypothetical protein
MKSGSAAVPVYRMESGGRVRFAVAYYRNGKRLRQVFQTLDAAKKEAQLVAQRIQSGMQQMTDLKPHDREKYLAARTMADEVGLPLVSAMEDYLRARKMAGTESLAAMASEYLKHFGNVTRRATEVPEIVAQILESRKQDGSGKRHLAQLRSVLNRFATSHPGQILDITSSDIDAWLRGLNVSPSSRNSMLLYVNILFSFALEPIAEGDPRGSDPPDSLALDQRVRRHPVGRAYPPELVGRGSGTTVDRDPGRSGKNRRPTSGSHLAQAGTMGKHLRV